MVVVVLPVELDGLVLLRDLVELVLVDAEAAQQVVVQLHQGGERVGVVGAGRQQVPLQ